MYLHYVRINEIWIRSYGLEGKGVQGRRIRVRGQGIGVRLEVKELWGKS